MARIYDPRRAVIYERLGIPTVATVPWTTDQVMRRLFPEHWPPSGRTARAACARRAGPPAGMGGAGTPRSSIDESIRLVAVTRDGTARLATSGLVGQEGDVLLFLVRLAVDDTRACLAGLTRGRAH